jgi:hypothetical protein
VAANMDGSEFDQHNFTSCRLTTSNTRNKN